VPVLQLFLEMPGHEAGISCVRGYSLSIARSRRAGFPFNAQLDGGRSYSSRNKSRSLAKASLTRLDKPMTHFSLLIIPAIS